MESVAAEVESARTVWGGTMREPGTGDPETSVFTMRLVEELIRREWHFRPRVVVTVGTLAALLVCALWLAGADGGAMKILLVSILYPLVAYLAYLSDPRGGMISARRGAIVGGLSLPLWAAWVVCRSSYERRGVPYPNTLGELFLSLFASVFLMGFGAGVGLMTGVIGGRVMRMVGGFGTFALSGSRRPERREKSSWQALRGAREASYFTLLK
jgi:hypothetical protein